MTIAAAENLPLNLPQDHAWAIAQKRLPELVEQLRAPEAATMRRVDPSGMMVLDAETGVAEIPIVGVLTQRSGYFTWLYGGFGTAEIAAAVQQAAGDPRVKAILLHVDSPGGQTRGTPDLADAIFAARKSKPIYAQVAGDCCSAALWVAAQADKIFAGRMDEIGSIGVRMLLWDNSRAHVFEGSEPIVITTGEHKATGVAGIGLTPAQTAELQANVDAWQNEFVAALVRGRGLTEAAVRALADGRSWFAPQAVANGLIDAVQSKAETIAQLLAKAGKQKPPSSPRSVYPMTTPAPAAAAAPNAIVEAAAAPLAPQPATLAQLKAQFPEATAEWRETQQLANATLDQAKDAYIKHLGEASKAKDAAHAKALADAAKPAPAALPGAEPLKTSAAGQQGGSNSGDALADWDSRLAAKIIAGKTRAQATRELVAEAPELHRAYLAAHNEANKKHRN